MNYRSIFSAKVQNAPTSVVFNVLSQLQIGETIATATVTAAVYSGDDPSPGTLLSGAPVISGSNITQALIDGVVGVTYILQCIGTGSKGSPFSSSGYLNVKNPGT